MSFYGDAIFLSNEECEAALNWVTGERLGGFLGSDRLGGYVFIEITVNIEKRFKTLSRSIG